MQNKNNSSEPSVLIATQDASYALTLERFIPLKEARIDRVHDGAGVLRLVGRRNFHIIVLDLKLGQGSTVDLVSYVREKAPEARLILLFEMPHLEQALEGVRQGAFFYLPNSCPPGDVALAIEKALRQMATERSMATYEQTVFEEMAGKTPAMERVVELIRKVAPTDSTVLLLGESGTGKEVLAGTIHRLSRRKEAPFVAVNCAALPESLLESELFGHVKGAFTGADRDKRGLFEEADGGTLFLDEIGDMSLITQAKLLRVLQNGEIRPVGSNTVQRVDVRVLAATNRDLVEAVRQHHFREDLYFRLNVIQLRIPPLRERMDAIPPLVQFFLQRHNRRFGKALRGFDDGALRLLEHYPFPGNVRELESIVAHAVIMADGPYAKAEDLPDEVRFGHSPRLAIGYTKDNNILSLAELEAQHIQRTLEQLDGNQTLASKKLGISRSTLWRKMKEYEIPS